MGAGRVRPWKHTRPESVAAVTIGAQMPLATVMNGYPVWHMTVISYRM